jgi:hypothetical protein
MTGSYALPSIFKNNLLVCSTVSTIEFEFEMEDETDLFHECECPRPVSLYFNKGGTEWCEVQFSTNGQKIPVIRRDAWNGGYLVYSQWTFRTDRSYQTVDGILVKTSCSCFLVDRSRRRFRHWPFSRFSSLIVHSTDQMLRQDNRYRVMMVSAIN